MSGAPEPTLAVGERSFQVRAYEKIDYSLLLVDGVFDVIHAIRFRKDLEHWGLELLAGLTGVAAGVLALMAEKCTKMSSPPSSGAMNPNPLASLNHLTVP